MIWYYHLSDAPQRFEIDIVISSQVCVLFPKLVQQSLTDIITFSLV